MTQAARRAVCSVPNGRRHICHGRNSLSRQMSGAKRITPNRRADSPHARRCVFGLKQLRTAGPTWLHKVRGRCTVEWLFRPQVSL